MGRNAYPRARGPCHDAGMSDTDPAPTSPIGTYDTSRTYRAEDDISGGGGSRALARLLTPVLAVLPWLLTMAGVGLAAEWQVRYQMRFETQWAFILGAAALLAVAALIWGAITAWSSVGTVLAGLLTLALGLAVSVPEIGSEVFRLGSDLPGDGRWWYTAVSSINLLVVGSLLLGAGVGASGARRMRR